MFRLSRVSKEGRGALGVGSNPQARAGFTLRIGLGWDEPADKPDSVRHAQSRPLDRLWSVREMERLDVSTFSTADEAYSFAAANGLDFDAQDDYCEACRAFHVGIDHTTAVPDPCGSVGMWGFNRVAACARPQHEGKRHRDLAGTEWNDA